MTGSPRAAFAAAAALLFASCGGQERGDATPTPSPVVFAAPPTEPSSRPDTEPSPEPREPLPRAAAEAQLGMTRREVEEELGKLQCHDNPGGFEVCKETSPRADPFGDLEIYFHRGRALSLAYNAPLPEDAWGYLDQLIRRHGKPSLSGLVDQDKQGRVHEIYGWKDDNTLLSVRFIWVEEAPNPRRLAAVALTVWDRKAYEEWEHDPNRSPPGPTPTRGLPPVADPELT